ncbi:MAG: dihydropteroate synthase [Planctomycetes bacterium]|nr:dihydropteroate synthase [Planctomycetota bacterium]
MLAPRLFGIVNVTADSFSDGGRWLDPQAAIAHAEELLAAGAHVLDLGAESTHPDAEDVAADEEIRRLAPVVEALVARGAEVSIDTTKGEVMRAMVARGARWLNDVNGFREADALQAAAGAPAAVRFVVMYSRSSSPRAGRPAAGADGLLDELAAFVTERRAAFAKVGVAAERLVFDPGMGFFLGREAAPSLTVLRHLERLVAIAGPPFVSVSRKSFLGEVTGSPVARRGAATLCAELWAARHGAGCLRTHDVRALRDALLVENAIAGAP